MPAEGSRKAAQLLCAKRSICEALWSGKRSRLGTVKLLLQASRFAAEHQDAALVTVVATSGSTPRHPGTRMLVAGDGTQLGTIGGGRIEFELVTVGREVAVGGPARLVKHNLVQDLSMCCGGTMEVYVERLAPCLEAISKVIARHVRRQHSVLVTSIVGGGKTVCPVDESATYPRMQDEQFMELIAPAPRVLLFGCGHLARALGPLAKTLDFDVIICDDNETGAIDECPEWASDWVSSFALIDIEARVGGLGAGDYLLVVTRDHGIDETIVESALPRVSEFEYLGLIGSMGKVGRFRKRILAKGAVTEDQWKSLHAPLGLDIAAETPQEIAVSIMAELVAIKNRANR